jgi:hypothetical protein
MPSALRINSNTDNGFERILHWKRIEYFPGCRYWQETRLLYFPTLRFKTLRQLLLGLNSGRYPCTAKLEGCSCITKSLDFWKQSQGRVSLPVIAKEVTVGFRIARGNALGFTLVVVGEWVQKGLSSLFRNCDWCDRLFWGRIKNLQAKSETAVLRSGGIQQVSLQGCDVCLFSCKLSKVSVLGGLYLLNKEVSEFLSVLCGWANPCLRRHCAAFGFPEDTQESCLLVCGQYQWPAGLGLDKFES